MSTTETTKLCIACSKWVPEDMKSCYCGHVFKQQKSINGKRFTEGRFYYEIEEEDFMPKKKQKIVPSVFYRERVTYMPGYSYEDDYEIQERKEKKKKKKKPLNLINASLRYNSNTTVSVTSSSINMNPKEMDLMVDGEPLLQVLQEINNKISNQRRLWINLDP